MAEIPANLSPSSAPPLDSSVRIRLSVMMFLQYAIWGAWLPLFYPFLTEHRGFTGEQAGWLFGIAALGAVVAPFIAGQIADRYLATEKFLAISHILGGVLVWQLARLETFNELLIFGLLYSLIYAPTLPLTNSLAFHHLPDRDRDFGTVRVWGTIGWIVVGIGIGQWLAHHHTPTAEEASERVVRQLVERGPPNLGPGAPVVAPVPEEDVRRMVANSGRHLVNADIRAAQVAGMGDSFRVSAILGIVLGLFCFLLPHTPPQKGAPLAFVEALREVKRNPLLTLFLVSFPIACVHQFYFVRTSGYLDHLNVRSPWIDSIFGYGGGPMTIGQIAEIVVLAGMAPVAKRLSRKTLLLIGLVAYAARFAIFAYLPYPEFVYPALALHGLCYGCFFFVAFMIIDEYTTPDVRASAQSLYNLVIIGFGVIVGNIAAGQVDRIASLPGGKGTDFRTLFEVPLCVVVVCIGAHLLFYPGGRRQKVSGF